MHVSAVRSLCALQARDLVYVGGDRASPPPSKHPSMAMPFVFGCQTYETGLFRTQLENGIMGLANLDNTIVPQLKVRLVPYY